MGLLGAVGLIAAPFTGGASLALVATDAAAEQAKKNRQAAEAAQARDLAAAAAARKLQEAQLVKDTESQKLAYASLTQPAPLGSAPAMQSGTALDKYLPLLIVGVAGIAVFSIFRKGV